MEKQCWKQTRNEEPIKRGQVIEWKRDRDNQIVKIRKSPIMGFKFDVVTSPHIKPNKLFKNKEDAIKYVENYIKENC